MSSWIVERTEVSPDRVWIQIGLDDGPVAIHVVLDGNSVQVEPGDCVWFRRRQAWWTPRLGRGLNHLDSVPLELAGHADPEVPWAERRRTKRATSVTNARGESDNE